MGVFWRGKEKKTWYVDYYFSGFRIRKGGFSKKSDAQNYLTKCRNDILYRKHPVPRSKSISFNELVQKYIKDHSLPRKTQKSYRTDVSLIKSLLPAFDGFLVRDITIDLVTRYMRERITAPNRRGGTLSKITVNREVGLLRNMLNMAVEWGLIEYNPILRVKMYKEEPRERILTEKELQALVDAANSPLREIIVTALNTGMRRGEILGLKWDHVNLDAGFVVVEKTKTNRIRHVPLNDTMKGMLSQLQLNRAGNQYVFTNSKTARPFSEIKTAWRTLLRKCNADRFRFHDLRHCFGSYTMANGGNLFDLKEVLGHEKIATTARYVKSMMEGKQRLVDGFQIGAKVGEIQNIQGNSKLG